MKRQQVPVVKNERPTREEMLALRSMAKALEDAAEVENHIGKRLVMFEEAMKLRRLHARICLRWRQLEVRWPAPKVTLTPAALEGRAHV